MKLRNKKTGEIIELDYITVNEYIITLHTNNPKTEEYCYSKLLSIYEDWEDYKPAEPLIKDEKVRKAVRAWAEANGYDKLWVYHDHDAISFYNEDDGDNEIIFTTVEKFGLEHLKCYTIAELCGEEKECKS